MNGAVASAVERDLAEGPQAEWFLQETDDEGDSPPPAPSPDAVAEFPVDASSSIDLEGAKVTSSHTRASSPDIENAGVLHAGPTPASSGGSPPAASSTHSGLLRSPATGGVQSATSSHGLPDPAVAVRNLVAQSKRGHLCSIMSSMHHRRAGFPFTAQNEFATDARGHPIFPLSPLSVHARNLLADPRCTLVVQIPGWSGLADARVTFFGEVHPVPREHQAWANGVFGSQHGQELSSQWGNTHFFRMDVIRDVYFVGGFGTVSWIDASQYSSVQPDKIASEDSERTLRILNANLGAKLRDSLCGLLKAGAPPVDSVAFIAVDGKGVDIRVQQGAQGHVRRLGFELPEPVESVEEAEAALEDLLRRSALPADLVEQNK